MKKQMVALVLLCLALAGVAMAAKDTPPMPKIFANARFVFVTSYDGDQYNPNILPDDRAAISRVQDSLQKWGKLTLVYRPEDADIVLAVQSRPTEDIVAVYDAHSTSQTYLWRVMGRGGLQKGETPLVTQFQKAFEKIAN
ncbi:MAG TPA: hypothetical protein VNW47_01860 [Terriglobales bacterium]|jgi:hypothetical protein|nr:hypothetical protein [Terriglobales bacterium]